MICEVPKPFTDFFPGTVFGLCQTIGAAGLLAANYVVSEGLHGSVRKYSLRVNNTLLHHSTIFFKANIVEKPNLNQYQMKILNQSENKWNYLLIY